MSLLIFTIPPTLPPLSPRLFAAISFYTIHERLSLSRSPFFLPTLCIRIVAFPLTLLHFLPSCPSWLIRSPTFVHVQHRTPFSALRAMPHSLFPLSLFLSHSPFGQLLCIVRTRAFGEILIPLCQLHSRTSRA